MIKQLGLVETKKIEEPSELPEGWKWVKLADVVFLESGGRPKGGVTRYTSGVPSIGGEHLNSNGGFNFENIKYVPENFFSSLAKGKVRKKDVLVVKDGATTGKVSFVGDDFPFEQAAVNEHVFIVRANEQMLSPKLLFYHIFSRGGQLQIKANFRGLQGGINQKFAENYYLPLPPQNEQKRLVAILDAAFSRLSKVEEFLNESGKVIDKIMPAAIKKAFRGEL